MQALSRAEWSPLAGFTIAIAVIIVALQVEMRAPTVNVFQKGKHIQVNVRQFGSFMPKVSRIRLTDQSSNTVVLDLQRNVGTPCLYFFSLSEGLNTVSGINASASCAVYRVVRGNYGFELKKGSTYMLSIWGNVVWGHHADTIFQIQ
jgi:hypothetical protein